ncbi:MAG: phosphoribosylglycinamide formyltransferase, partial [Deltaproteobacteria bacterium]|nr:phosphoribosylglycinamide formyltransferase [Deltaproteobacteria bacterium]
MSLKLAILASGNGSNFQAIIDSIQSKKLDATIQLLISDQPTAYALKRAEQHHIPSHVFTRKNFSDTLSFEKIIVETLKQSEVDWVVLAGYMRILSPFFVQSFPQKILNIHPSLLPAFPGLNAIGQAFDYGCKVTGCTVHLVDEGCDTGAIIGQRSVV